MKTIWNYTVASFKVLSGFAIIGFSFFLIGILLKIVWTLFLLGFNLW